MTVSTCSLHRTAPTPVATSRGTLPGSGGRPSGAMVQPRERRPARAATHGLCAMWPASFGAGAKRASSSGASFHVTCGPGRDRLALPPR